MPGEAPRAILIAMPSPPALTSRLPGRQDGPDVRPGVASSHPKRLGTLRGVAAGLAPRATGR
jgi:hypothetical protein